MRLDKLIANATAFSRSQAHKVIKKGLVRVDGTVITLPAQQIDDQAQVSYQGVPVKRPSLRYLMFHKPADVVCANRDNLHRTVIDFLVIARRETLRIGGRLDIDTTGLVLLSDDGQWIHRLTSPRHSHQKVYRVALELPVSQQQIESLQDGVMLTGERKKTRPAKVEKLDDHTIHLAITEGKYHQVKRMLTAVGNSVSGLHRESIGPIRLDPYLPEGEWRELTKAEYTMI